MKHTRFESFLSDREKSFIEQFYSNEDMREAVRKVLLASKYANGVFTKDNPASPINCAFSLLSREIDGGGVTNEKLGSDLRVLWEATNLVEAAFNEMSKYKIETPILKGSNPAR